MHPFLVGRYLDRELSFAILNIQQRRKISAAQFKDMEAENEVYDFGM